MVSFWPFGGDENSAAAFEKTLSTLSAKIQRSSATNDTLRQHQRRYKALWTLYTIFAYILVTAILTLVTGLGRWGSVEYSAVAGGPVLIYVVRLSLETYYNWRIAKSDERLATLNQERDKVIERLKAATKYNSTQQLLDKYGKNDPTQQQQQQQQRKAGQSPGKRKASGPTQQQSGGMTGIAPPPTANIPSRQPIPRPQAPPGPNGQLQPPNEPPGEEFAPNAFATPTPRRPAIHSRQASIQYAHVNDGPKWYDRLMDVVLGEDETQAKNRFALICRECRLVNGQAPPGAKTLEEVGKWRCSACGTLNGVESEASQVIKAMGGVTAQSEHQRPVSAGSLDVPSPEMQETKGLDESEDETSEIDADSAAPPAGSTRSKARQKKKA